MKLFISPQHKQSQCFSRSLGSIASVVTLALSLAHSSLQAQTIHFDALGVKGGKTSSSSCVSLDAEGNLATIVELGADMKKATLVVDGKKIPLSYVVNDINSRLVLYKLPKDAVGKAGKTVELGTSLSLVASQSVYASPSKSGELSRVVGRVGQFQGKTLPLAVIRLNHPQSAPLQGSGVFDDQGKLVGLIRQSVLGAPKSSYCLPVEVITRTLKDLKKNGKVRRCWIGIVMDELVVPPIVESIRPSSPAQKAGLKKGDVILSIGTQKVSDYAEVVDAFFYLIAGEPSTFKVLRGTEVKEIIVNPEVCP